MKVTFKSLTGRIKVAEGIREKTRMPRKIFWDGYISAMRDLRDNINSKD